MAKPKLIVCAAIRNTDTGVVICGPRHSHCFVVVSTAPELRLTKRWEQGFVDQEGMFHDRETAWKVADAAGQIRCPTGLERDYSQHRPAGVGDDGILFSENLY